LQGLLGLLLIAAHPVPAAQESAAAVWLRANAIPISTVSPDAPPSELGAASAIFADARVIGAGEATHGSREIFQLKDRLFRFLVEQHGFTAFAIEANFAEAERINDYVHGGAGDAEQLVSAMGFWTWDTEEVLALVSWMRRYNRDHGNRLSFYGVDIQFAPSNLAIATAYLERFGGADRPDTRPFAAYVAGATDIAAGYRLTASYTPEVQRQLLDQSMLRFRYLEDNRARLEAASGQAAYRQARSAALATTWYFVMEAPASDRRFRNLRLGYDIRDRAMADLVGAALEREGEQGKVFVWAHNAHVSEARHVDERMTMGQFLAAEFGRSYLSIGFAFDNGRFQAMPPADPARPDARRVLTEMAVGPAPPDHSEALLRTLRSPYYVVDLRRLDPGTPAYAWFHARRPLRWTGANYSVELMALHPPISLLDSYDALIFVRETSRARPLRYTREQFGIVKDW